MPLGKSRFDFSSQMHPLQIDHQDLLVKKEEAYKKLKQTDSLDQFLIVKKLSAQEIHSSWDPSKKLNKQTDAFIEKLNIDHKFFLSQIGESVFQPKTPQEMLQHLQEQIEGKGVTQQPMNVGGQEKDNNEIQLDV
jgi:chromatin segregation and condensation protein Rec8/ScpA/Scc1 (kleisin family)